MPASPEVFEQLCGVSKPPIFCSYQNQGLVLPRCCPDEVIARGLRIIPFIFRVLDGAVRED